MSCRRILRVLVVSTVVAASLTGAAGRPTAARAASVAFVGASSAGLQPGGTSLTLPRPAGTAAGHVMVAAVGIVDDDPDFGAPPGWTLVREDHLHDAFRQNIYVKVAGTSEPAGYTWTLSDWRRMAGGIAAYSGVDASDPVADHGALVQGTAGTDTAGPPVVAPAGAALVHFAVTNSESALTPPAGMSERWETSAWRAGSTRDITMSSADEFPVGPGTTGTRAGTASLPGPRAGALVALRPAGDPAPPPAGDGIAVVASSSDSSSAGRKSITVGRPAGTVGGDVMVAALASVDDDPSYAAPPGWTLVRSEAVHDRLRVEVFTRVAGSSEPDAYTWTLADWRRVAGGITSFRGVDTTHPVDAHGGSAQSADGTAVTAPSVSASVAGTMLVDVAAVSAEAALSPPPGMEESWEAKGWRVNSPRDVTIASFSALQAAAGESGARTATASTAGSRIGLLVALRPHVEPAPDETAPETAITAGPSGTVTSPEAQFGFSSSEAGSTFECRLDDGPTEACVSPKTYTGLADGEHTFQVTAIDPAANADPTPASRTWTIDTVAPAPITAVGSASDSATEGRKSITIGKPAGTVAGDVMVAALASVDDDPAYSAPSGWSRVRSEWVLDRLRVEVFTKTAGGSEPAAYTWTLTDWRRVAGGITTFRGVHPTRPVDTHSGASSAGDSTAITAPAVTPSAPGTMLVHVAAVSAEAGLDPPAGMGEDWEARGWRADAPRDVTIAASHALQAAAGATGNRTATASRPGAGAAVLLALLPEGATPVATDPYTPIGTFAYTEISGVVASRRYPGVVWAQRDSGDGVREMLYAFRVLDGALQPFPTGEMYKAFPVPGTINRDWEDIAIDDDGNLYVGDIGNNSTSRTDLRVYKVREPDPYSDTSATLLATYPFRYPALNYDAESLFFHDGTLYLINKVGPPTPHTLFRFDTLTDNIQTTLVPVVEMTEPSGGLVAGERMQAADLATDSRFLAITTGYRIYLYAAPSPAAGAAGVTDLVSRPPAWSLSHRADGTKEQVEAVTFLPGGSLVTASEFEGRIRHVDSSLRPET